MARKGTEISDRQTALRRILAASAIAFVSGISIYFLVQSVGPESGLISFSFLFILPAVLCAFIAYVADPLAQRRRLFYLLVPAWVLAGTLVVSVFLLQEGVICILMLLPLWAISGIAGSFLVYALRRKERDRRESQQQSRVFSAAILLLPLIAMQAETMIEWPKANYSVTRSIVIEAPAEVIWPLVEGIPNVQPGEGRWNLSQDVIGIPRPLGAELEGNGVGATRYARWARDIQFSETIVEWQEDRRIGWEFDFEEPSNWGIADPHLHPDSTVARVVRGGYTIEALGPNRTRVSLGTHYWVRTPANAYSALWGQLILGDLSNNLLALIKQRAERLQPEQAINTQFQELKYDL